MPGILDFLNQPDAQLGMGLLASGGPTTDPNQTGIGQRVAGAVNSVQAQQQNAIKTKLMAAQQQEAMQNAQMQQFQLKRLQDWQSMVMGDSAGQSPMGSSPASTAQAGGVMPSGADSMGGGAAPGGMPSGATPQRGYPQAQQTPQIPQSAQSNGRSFQFAIPGLGDQQSRVLAASMPPADYLKMYAGAAVPQTEIGKLLVQANIDPKSPLGLQLTQQSIAKSNYIAPVSGRPGGYLANADGSIKQLPHVPDGFTAIQGADGQFHMVPVDGGLAAMQQSAGATALGKAGAEPTVAYKGNTPIFSTKAQDVGRANGASPALAGQPAYSAAFNGLPPAQGGMSSSFQGPPEQVLPLIAGMKDPQERANAYDAYSRQMTGGGTTQGAAAPNGEATPVPALGAVANSNAAQQASATTMHSSYANLQSSNSTAQAALEALDKMQGLASKKNAILTAGPLGTNQSAINPDAAEYEKQRANVISLLAAQNGTNGTDAGRSLTGDSVPDFGKPKPAIQDGLQTLKNQTIVRQLKTNFLTPVYQAGDSKAYTTSENQFDQNISPSIVPILTMPGGQSRAMLINSLIAKDPSMKGRLNWAAENGLLK
jgi:hypothetical protein